MKKLVLVGLLVVSSVMLIGCTAEEGDSMGTSSMDGNFTKLREGGRIDVYKDDETGCEYLFYRTSTSNSAVGGVSPYYNENGTIKGCGEF